MSLIPSRYTISKMLYICEQYGKEYEYLTCRRVTSLLYNDYLNQLDIPPLYLNDEALYVQNNAIHLRHHVCNVKIKIL